MEHITMGNIISIVVGFAAIAFSFAAYIRNTKKDARDDTSVDSIQNERLVELNGKVDVVKAELQGEINMIKGDVERIKGEVIGIIKKLDRLIDHLINNK